MASVGWRKAGCASAAASALLGWLAFGSTSAMAAVQQPQADGPLTTRTIEFAGLVDAARGNRRVPIKVHLPSWTGSFPVVVLSHGAGAEVRSATGITVFAGMLGVTLFGLFLTPVFYVALRKLVTRRAPARNLDVGHAAA